MNFLPDGEVDIVNHTGLQKNYTKIRALSHKKKKKKKESLQDEGIDTKFSYQMLPWISLRSHKHLDMLILEARLSLTNKIL